jgi:hypothetical protein
MDTSATSPITTPAAAQDAKSRYRPATSSATGTRKAVFGLR